MDLALEDEFLARQLPHNLEAEQAVLGSMLIDQNCIKDVMDKLQPGDFYLQQNRDIFETMYTMFSYSRPIDPVTVVGEMQKNGTFDENTTQNYIIQLMDITPTSANVMEYVALVRGKSLLRSVATAAGGDHFHGARGQRRSGRCAGGGGTEDLRCAAGAGPLRIWRPSARCFPVCWKTLNSFRRRADGCLAFLRAFPPSTPSSRA